MLGARVEGAPDGLFSTEVRTVVPDEHYIVKVRVLKTVPESQVRALLVIDVDDPRQSNRTVQLFAQFRRPPPGCGAADPGPGLTAPGRFSGRVDAIGIPPLHFWTPQPLEALRGTGRSRRWEVSLRCASEAGCALGTFAAAPRRGPGRAELSALPEGRATERDDPAGDPPPTGA